MLRLLSRILAWRASVNRARSLALVAAADAYDASLRRDKMGGSTLAHVTLALSLLGVAYAASYVLGAAS